MPGKPWSDEPAIEGPARMKAKARMKLMVRMCLSPVSVAGVPAVSLARVIANGCFRISAPKGENGFIAGENCFVGRAGRNIGGKN